MKKKVSVAARIIAFIFFHTALWFVPNDAKEKLLFFGIAYVLMSLSWAIIWKKENRCPT